MTTSDQKKCIKCGFSKPITEFPYINKSKVYRNSCKICVYNKYKKHLVEIFYENKTQRCVSCQIIKPFEDFNTRKYKNGYLGLMSKCKNCVVEVKRKNKNKSAKIFSQSLRGKEILKLRRKIRRADPEKRKIDIEKCKQWHVNNKEKENEYKRLYEKNKKANDNNYKLRRNISSIIWMALKKNNSKKGTSCSKYLPYTMKKLSSHLQNQFEPWMNWKNWGRYKVNFWNDQDPTTWTWQIDHIVPQAMLPYTSMEDENFKKCWSLDNLRPLSSKQNHQNGLLIRKEIYGNN